MGVVKKPMQKHNSDDDIIEEDIPEGASDKSDSIIEDYQENGNKDSYSASIKESIKISGKPADSRNKFDSKYNQEITDSVEDYVSENHSPSTSGRKKI
jgi:hypothetical protein